MSLSLRSSLVALLLTVVVAACVETKPLSEGQDCPCAPGWKCDATVRKCLPEQDASADFHPMGATDTATQVPWGQTNCYPIGPNVACDPTGNWTVSFSDPSGACSVGGSGRDHGFTILAENDLFCILNHGTAYDTLTVSPDGCKLDASGSRRSGANAQILESWDLSLTIAGTQGQGTLAHHLQADAICDVTWNATGQRSPLTDGGLVAEPQ